MISPKKQKQDDASPDDELAQIECTSEVSVHGMRPRLLKKLAAAIHISGNLSLIQNKLNNAFLHLALPSIRSEDIHQAPLRTICNLIGYDSNDTAPIKRDIEILNQTAVVWDLLNDDGSKEWGTAPLVAGVKIVDGMVSWSYSPFLKEKLIESRVFGLINMTYQPLFKSRYGLRLYENCVRFRNTGSTGFIALEIWRALLGIQDDQHTEFKYFKRDALMPGIREVNEITDIHLEPEFKKGARGAITHIRFLITSNSMPAGIIGPASASPPIQEVLDPDKFALTPTEDRPLAERLVSHLGIKPSQAMDLISEHDEDYLARLLDYVLAQHAKAPKKNLAGYFMTCLKKAIQIPSPAGNTRGGMPSRPSALKSPSEPADVVAARKASRSHKERAEALLESLEDEDRAALVTDFLASIPSAHPIRSAYVRSGESAPMFRMSFYEWLVKQMPD